MRVNDKRKDLIALDDLEPGDCFLYEGEHYMKTDEAEFNVVALYNGHLYEFEGATRVQKIEIEAEVV